MRVRPAGRECRHRPGARAGAPRGAAAVTDRPPPPLTIADLKRALTARVEDVTAYLLPNGKRDRNEWRVGSVDGEEGQSLGVHLAGAKAGVWHDFAADEGGDLIDLWKAT